MMRNPTSPKTLINTYLIQTGLRPIPRPHDLRSLQSNQLGKDTEQLQVTGGRDVVMTSHLQQVLARVVVYCGVDVLAHGHLEREENRIHM